MPPVPRTGPAPWRPVSRIPSTPDDESVPAGFGSRLILTVTPFAMAAVVWLLLRAFGG